MIIYKNPIAMKRRSCFNFIMFLHQWDTGTPTKFCIRSKDQWTLKLTCSSIALQPHFNQNTKAMNTDNIQNYN